MVQNVNRFQRWIALWGRKGLEKKKVNAGKDDKH
jgi:hypothetical protein